MCLLSKRRVLQPGTTDPDATTVNDDHPWSQYNTCYWKLVQSGRTRQQAQSDLKVAPPPFLSARGLVLRTETISPCHRAAALHVPALLNSASFPCMQGTVTQQKNELLFSKFSLNYSDLPAQFRKASKTSAV